MSSRSESHEGLQQKGMETGISPVEDSSSSGPESQSGKKRVVMWILVLAIGLAVTAGFLLGHGWWLQDSASVVSVEDARVVGDFVSVSSTIIGRIRLLSVQEGDRVEIGQLIAQFEDEELRAHQNTAAASVRAAEAEIKETEARVASARQEAEREVNRLTAALDEARVRLKEAQNSLRLAHQGPRRGYVYYESRPDLEMPSRARRSLEDPLVGRIHEATTRVKEAEVRLQAARVESEELVMNRQHMEVLRARLAQAQGELHSATLRLNAASVHSPIEGIVVKKRANVGEVLGPGQVILTVLDPRHRWVESDVDQTLAGLVKEGQTAAIGADAYPGVHFAGKVVKLGTAGAPDRTSLPKKQLWTIFGKDVRRIPVRIDVNDGDMLLKPGMTVSARIYIADNKTESGLETPGRQPLTTVSPVEAGR